MNRPLKEFCNAWKAIFKCDETDCTVCSFLAFVQAVTKNHEKGTTMSNSVRVFVRSRIARKKARRIIEESIGMPLEVAQAVLRESNNESD